MKSPTTTAALVLAARGGDREAFGALAERYRWACLGQAVAQLGERAAAADAVQDALVDAWLHLGQLRSPEAFGAWLRRAVFKHCDRQRRRRREVATAEPVGSSAAAGAAALDDRERWARLRAAIERLPDHERVVVGLHYLGGAPISEIAAFLAVSEPAVKKRLHSARKRLHAQESPMSDPRPSLPDRVALSLAIRAGDLDEVRALVRDRPELVDAEEAWTAEEALDGGFPLAHPTTPLALAASTGDLPIVRALLAAGADPDGRCGCRNGESVIGSAARHGHADVVAALMEGGASPGIRHRTGLDLADFASWRGDARLLELARAHGLAPRPADRPVSAFAIGPDDAVHTGIGAIDLWAPLRRYDLVRVEGAAETGLMVLLSELAWAVGDAGGRTLWSSWVPRPWHARELQGVAARGAVEGHVEVLTPATARMAGPEELLPTALDRLAGHDGRPSVHVVFEQPGHAADLAACLPALSAAADLTFVVRPWAAVTRGDRADLAWAAAIDARLATDPWMAARGFWPAIDPSRSRTRRVDDPITASARALVECRERPDRDGELARALLAALVQPFRVATPDTGRPGESWPRGEARSRVEAVMSRARVGTAPSAS